MNYKGPGIAILICFSILLGANEGNKSSPDSLVRSANRVPFDTLNVLAMVELSGLALENDADTCLYYAHKALFASKKLQWTRGEALALLHLGMGYRAIDQFAIGKTNLLEACSRFLDVRDYSGLAKALHQLASIFKDEGDYIQAETYFDKALIATRKAGDNLMLSRVYAGMSDLFHRKGHFDQSIEYGLQALEIQKFRGDTVGWAMTLDRLGEVYTAIKDHALALVYYKQALQLRLSFSKVNRNDLAQSAMVIGETYLAMDSLKEAEQTLTLALFYFQEARNKQAIGDVQLTLAEVAFKQQRNPDAQVKVAEALNIFRELKNKSKELNCLYLIARIAVNEQDWRLSLQEAQSYHALAESEGNQQHKTDARFLLYTIYVQTGNYKQALEWHELFLQARDSLWNEHKLADIARLESQIALAQKEKETVSLQLKGEVLAQRLHQQQKWSNVILFATIILSLFLVILVIQFLRNRKHLKALKISNEEIQEKSERLVLAEQYLQAINDNLEEIVQVRTAELQRSNEKLEHFAYLASHDLKQPLSTIRGFTQLLHRDLSKQGQLSSRLKEYIEFITGGVNYMNQLMDDILRYGKYATTDGNTIQSVQLGALLDQVKQNLRKDIMRLGAQINVSGSLIIVEGVRFKLERMLQAIISNSLKYTRPNIAPVIQVVFLDKEEHVEIIISDNGPGIPKADQENIFQFFQPGSQGLQAARRGMSLTICKKIVEQHGGKIWVKSNPESGTEFHLTLKKVATELLHPSTVGSVTN